LRAEQTDTELTGAAIANLEQLIELELRLAWVEVNRAHQQIEASAITVALQEETLEAEQQRLEAGASTPLLVAQAQRDLLEAQVVAVDSAIAYRIALVVLYRSEGSLLERRGISLGE
jgi:outer membrane protein